MDLLIGNDKPPFCYCTWGICSCTNHLVNNTSSSLLFMETFSFFFCYFFFYSSAVSVLLHIKPRAELWNSDDPEARVKDAAVARWHSGSVLAAALVVLANTNPSLTAQELYDPDDGFVFGAIQVKLVPNKYTDLFTFFMIILSTVLCCYLILSKQQ